MVLNSSGSCYSWSPFGISGLRSTLKAPSHSTSGTYPVHLPSPPVLVRVLGSFGAMSRAGRLTASGRRDSLALLKLAKDIPTDSFPALKRSAASTLSIAEEVAV